MNGPQVAYLEHLIRTRGFHFAYYEPSGARYGLPTYPYRSAPEGYATIRQLRAKGLRPGGQEPCAQILWRRGLRVAYLYKIDVAKPKRNATPAQLAAIAKALRARRTCPTCGQEKWYDIPLRYGECNDCAADDYGEAA